MASLQTEWRISNLVYSELSLNQFSDWPFASACSLNIHTEYKFFNRSPTSAHFQQTTLLLSG